MGFYGNITNTTQTNFVFDKIYTNRHAMEQKLAQGQDDGVFIGRYVLIEYGEVDRNNSFIRAYKLGEKFYITEQENPNTELKYTDKLSEVGNNYVTKGISIYILNNNTYIYYQCAGPNSKDSAIPEFVQIDFKVLQSDPWYYNMQQDVSYGHSRGYDSTVWVKTTVNGEIKYVNIAELNSVIPTFQMVADAPTMSPILPHFDTASTNVYYKLHWQPAWGMRVAEAKAKNGKTYSDYETEWSQEVYNADGTTTVKWYNPSSGSWQENKGEDTKIKADIYFNLEAFEPQVGETEIKGEVTGLQNYIGITADGLSGNKYNKHDKTLDTEQKPDTQQIHINLPAIGNMMSQAWDIIHGDKRDDSTADSLQGRLDFFKKNISHNEIPVQSSGEEGYLVGSTINGNTTYEDSDIYNTNILSVEPNQSHLYDDPWIATSINTNEGKEGDKDYHRNAIAIHHTFHPRTDSNVNTLNINDQKVKDSGSTPDSDTKFQKIVDKDTIQLYVPKVDKTGHVVGTDIDKVILPYGYKHIETIGNKTSNEATDLDTTQDTVSADKGTVTAGTPIGATAIVANETQDTVNIDPFNKWIQIKASNNKIEIAHEIHGVVEKDKPKSDLNDDGTDSITIQDIVFDAAGHVTHNQKHKYELPYGFKHFTTNGRVTSTNDLYTTITQVTNGNDTETKATVRDNQKSCVANNTQDTLHIAAGNKWIQTAIVNNEDQADSLTIAHEIHAIKDSDATGTNLNGGNATNIVSDNIIIPDLVFDKAGHLTENHSHTYTLPYGFKTIKIGKQAENDDVSNLNGHTSDTSVIADNTQDILTILPANRWVCLHGTNDDSTNGDVIKVGHQVNTITTTANDAVDLNTNTTYGSMTNGNTIKIPDWTYDAAGHITAKQSRTYTLPYGYKKIVATNSTAVNVEPSNITVNPTADNTQDTLNIKAANKWIKLNTTDSNSISFAHALVDTNFGNIYYSNVDSSNTNDDHNRKLDFGSTFKIFNLTTDNAGHITNINTNDITLPTIALTNDDSGNMVTGISYSYNNTDHKGTFEETRANVGTLALTGYGVQQTEANKNTNIVTSSDSINTAFEKVENKINTFLQDASITENAIDTLQELQNYISTHTSEAADMVKATNNIYQEAEGIESGVLIDKTDALAERINNINGEVSADTGNYISSITIENDILSIGTTALPTLSAGSANGTIKLSNGNDVKVKGLGTAAYKNENAFATAAQGVLADKALPRDAKFVYTPETVDEETGEVTAAITMTIAELVEKVAELENEIKKLTSE